MARRDPGSVWNLLTDLWRELSWLMRVCGGLGLFLGLMLGMWLVSHVPRNEARYFRTVLLWAVLGPSIAGAVLGLALGALIEWLTRRPPPSKPSRRGVRD